MTNAEKMIVKETVPVLLKKMMPTENADYITELSAIIVDDILKYGYESKKITSDAKLEAFKNFLPIADKFLDNLHTAIKISEKYSEEHYDEIIDFIVENSGLTAKEKIHTYIWLEQEKDRLKKEWIMPFMYFVSAIAILIIVVKNFKTIVKIIKAIVNGIVKTVKTVSSLTEKVISLINR